MPLQVSQLSGQQRQALLTSPPPGHKRRPSSAAHSIIRGTTSSSVELSCLSPDGRAVHSLCLSSVHTVDDENRSGPPHDDRPTSEVFAQDEEETACIMTHFFPLADATNSEESTPSTPYSYRDVAISTHKNKDGMIIRTPLPFHVYAALQVDRPLGLICVDSKNDSSSSFFPADHETETTETSKRLLLPHLCLYTSKAAYLFSISYPVDTAPTTASGRIVALTEPFEEHLISSPPSTSILRIRPPPLSTISPAGAMAMLTNEGTLVLFHGVDTMTTVPLHSTTEQMQEQGHSSLSDFTFLPPTADIFAPMSVVLTMANGTLYTACPILFHKSLFSKSALQTGIKYLDQKIQECDRATHYWRRARAARQFLSDAFGDYNNTGGYYVVAKVLTTNAGRYATGWPVQMQGPILTSQPKENVSDVCCIEAFTPITELVGIALARRNHSVQIACLPFVTGTNDCIVVPRFEFESDEDAMALNDDLTDLGWIAQEMEFGCDEEGQYGEDRSSYCDTISLLMDPVDRNMIHHVSSRGVITITTNAMDVMEARLKAIVNDIDTHNFRRKLKGGDKDIKTNAWSCIEIATGDGNATSTFAARSAKIVGAVVSGDTQFGHILVVHFSNGQMETVNLTAAQYFHEAASLNSTMFEGSVTLAKTESMDEAMDAIPPFHADLAPLVEKIAKGLAGMGKIVGSATNPRDATPGTIATFLSVKRKCEQEVILPLKELNEITSTRVTYLQQMYQHQQEQLHVLRGMMQTLQDRVKVSDKKKSVAEANSELLSQRSAAVLTAARGLMPSISQAEHDYFQQIRRYEACCSKWETSVRQIKNKGNAVCDRLERGTSTCDVELNKAQAEMCHNLITGQSMLLERNALRIKDIEGTVKSLIQAKGLGDDKEESALYVEQSCRSLLQSS